MEILAKSTDISADDAAMALKSVLAPKKAANATTTDEDEDLVNDEETTRNIMNSAMNMTDSIMKRWKSGEAEFEMGDLTSMLEATSAISDEYTTIAKHKAKTYTTVATVNATNDTTNVTGKEESEYDR